MLSLFHSVPNRSDSIRDMWPSINKMVMTHDKRWSFWSIITYLSVTMMHHNRKFKKKHFSRKSKYSKRNAMQSSRKTVDSRPRRYQLLYPSLYWIGIFTNLMFPILFYAFQQISDALYARACLGPCEPLFALLLTNVHAVTLIRVDFAGQLPTKYEKWSNEMN